MSKATDYAKWEHERALAQPVLKEPRSGGQMDLACVNTTMGGPVMELSRRGTFIPEDALLLARWILDTFREES